ncbi:MAG TPA: ROK family protein, partial [Parafilimonas sp.]|nr:ROK family protein [Parafilimonas sp.]
MNTPLNVNAVNKLPLGDGGLRTIAIVMDIGGTKIKLGLVKDDKIICTRSIDADSANGLKEKLQVIAKLVDEMLLDQHVSLNDVAGVGISMPGIVDSKQKKVLSIDNKFNDVVELNLTEWVNNTWHTNLEMENDARCALIGEWKYGKGRSSDNVVLMTIGTGVGSSAVIEGNVLRGKHFQAGC